VQTCLEKSASIDMQKISTLKRKADNYKYVFNAIARSVMLFSGSKFENVTSEFVHDEMYFAAMSLHRCTLGDEHRPNPEGLPMLMMMVSDGILTNLSHALNTAASLEWRRGYQFIRSLYPVRSKYAAMSMKRYIETHRVPDDEKRSNRSKDEASESRELEPGARVTSSALDPMKESEVQDITKLDSPRP